jgi:hypothetical protein
MEYNKTIQEDRMDDGLVTLIINELDVTRDLEDDISQAPESSVNILPSTTTASSPPISSTPKTSPYTAANTKTSKKTKGIKR